MKIGIVGITGRVGYELTQLISKQDLIGGISSKTTPDECEKVIKNSDAIIDFSRPTATLQALPVAVEYGVPFISGTTGFTPDEFNQMFEFSQNIPILYTTNFSLGIQMIARMLRQCSQIFSDFDFSIIERHHAHKKDAPSGTALFLEKQVQQSKQIASIRAGNICGEHICAFTGSDEEVTISHRAFNRAIYAKGAIACAEWIIGKAPKLYTAEDFLQDRLHESEK